MRRFNYEREGNKIAQAPRDGNRIPTILGVSNVDFTTPTTIYVNPSTGALLVGAAGLGSVTSVSVATANGFSGTVANATTTPEITIIAGAITPTSVNGLTITTSTGTLTITNAKTFSVSNTLTLTATDGSTLAIGAGGTLGSNAYTSTAYAPVASPTFTGTVTIPTPFTLGATSVTSTGTQLNYLAAATGTTGTTSTNVVFSTSPVLTTPTITTSIVPTSDDSAALGSTSNRFSDLWLAEGGVINWDSGDATITQTNNVVLLAGATLETSTVGTAANSVATIDGTQTITNKRVTKRAPAITQSATPAINTDITDVAHITGLAQAITSMTSSLTGTPVEGDTLRIDITDNGTARGITWGASFESSGTVTLPSTTVLGVRLDVGFLWNTVTSKWRCVATA